MVGTKRPRSREPELSTQFAAVVGVRRRLARAALVALLHHDGGISKVHEADSVSGVLRLVRDVRPELLLMSEGFGNHTALDIIAQVGEVSPDTRTILLSDAMPAHRSMAGGRGGYVVVGWNDPLDVFIEQLALHRQVTRDEPGGARADRGRRLTSREIDVLGLLAEGMSNREIAVNLSISEGTVKRHLANMFRRLDVHSRIQAINTAIESGYLV